MDVESGAQDVRSRESSCCSPPSPSPPPRINSRIRWRHHDRRSIRIETRHRQKPLLFSTFGFATANPECRVTSQSQTRQIFRRQLHAFTYPPAPAPPRSPFNSHRNATSPKRYRGNRANSAQRECFFQIREHPMLPQQQPGIRIVVLSVSCLFLCGPLDVLVSTPDSMFMLFSFVTRGVFTGDRSNSRMRSRAN
ncbi:hypothetical protein NP493_101g07003 [Ridgeia piscesae]|uniref:Uncharacterized protein n=1 Tax=Ridgeia piscesae TaxID=27915 RepID=A0AAD9P7I9_RIDPI|nr:hypothetical protein NP493_101g07003 [Ridgeia piscesae]